MLECCGDRRAIVGKTSRDGEQFHRLHTQLRSLVIGVGEVVDRDGLVREQRDQPDHLTECLNKIVTGLERFAEVFESAVPGGNLAGCSGGEDQLVLTPTDDNSRSRPSRLNFTNSNDCCSMFENEDFSKSPIMCGGMRKMRAISLI